MSFFSDLFSWFKDLFKKVLDFLKENWLLILLLIVCILIMNPGLLLEIGQWIISALGSIGSVVLSAASWVGGLGFWQAIGLAASLWYVVDAEGFVEFLSDIVTAAGGIIADGIGSVTSGLFEGFISSPLGMLAVGGLVYWLIKDKKEKEEGESLNKDFGDNNS